MVSVLLTVLTLAIVQLGLALFVRNIVNDAAVEGAFHAALADTGVAEGEARVYEMVDRAVAADLVSDVVVVESGGIVTVTVRATLPLLGFWGVSSGMEVTAYAPKEILDR